MSNSPALSCKPNWEQVLAPATVGGATTTLAPDTDDDDVGFSWKKLKKKKKNYCSYCGPT